MDYTYLFGSVEQTVRVKIGKSNDPKKRLSTFRTSSITPVDMFGVSSKHKEEDLHEKYSQYRVKELKGTEIFDLPVNVFVKLIREMEEYDSKKKYKVKSVEETDSSSSDEEVDVKVEKKVEITQEQITKAVEKMFKEMMITKECEAKPDVKAEAKPDVKAEAKPDVKAEAKPDVKAEAKPDVKAEAKPDVKAEAKPDVKAEAKPDVKAEASEVRRTMTQAILDDAYEKELNKAVDFYLLKYRFFYKLHEGIFGEPDTTDLREKVMSNKKFLLSFLFYSDNFDSFNEEHQKLTVAKLREKFPVATARDNKLEIITKGFWSLFSINEDCDLTQDEILIVLYSCYSIPELKEAFPRVSKGSLNKEGYVKKLSSEPDVVKTLNGLTFKIGNTKIFYRNYLYKITEDEIISYSLTDFF